ncbi:MAG TPA: cytochrome c oxidase assembly protein [Solirubrobacteraceae bacterium]|nr:cytochrome c oxidase assembly protein [Solirubrobacteraceae bacterium]
MLGAEANPGLGSWSPDPALVIVIALAALYRLGDLSTSYGARRAVTHRWRAACFYAALVVFVLALDSPLDAYSERLFWVHMVQHGLLLTVVPPLIVLARPWTPLWRSLPLRTRRSLARAPARSAAMRGVWAFGGWLGRPAPSFVLFSVVLLGWHVPALFDATLRSQPLHALEHILFVFAAVLVFKQVIDSRPLRTHLGEVQRVLYATGAMLVTWVLAIALAIAPHPLYSSYAHEATRPGGISAFTDQQIAAGIMWVPGSVTLMVVVFVYIHRWLAPSSDESAQRLAAATGTGPSRLAGNHFRGSARP